MGCRRLWSLVKNLPPKSAVHRVQEPDLVQWGTTEELLAILIEVVDYGNRNYISKNKKKGSRAPKPIKIPRPKRAATPPKRRQSTPDEIKSFFGSRVRVEEEKK